MMLTPFRKGVKEIAALAQSKNEKIIIVYLIPK